MRIPEKPPGDGWRLIFRRCFRHHVTGKLICAKDGGCFPIWVRDSQA